MWLPGSYQVNDDRQRMAADPPTPRAACGLPEDAFVYCSFNQVRKLDARVRGLDADPGRDAGLGAVDSRRPPAGAGEPAVGGGGRRRRPRAASAFAEVVDKPAHLARHRLADLLLDTHTCCAHTTASDARWVSPLARLARRQFRWPRVGEPPRGDRAPGSSSSRASTTTSRPQSRSPGERQRLWALRARLEANRLHYVRCSTPLLSRAISSAHSRIRTRVACVTRRRRRSPSRRRRAGVVGER